MAETLTHTKLACFRACPRKAYLKYTLGLRRMQDDFALRVGSAFHAALEAQDKGLDPDEAIGEKLTDDYDMALVAAMFDAHTRRYADIRPETVASEQKFTMPLVNPDTGAASRLFIMEGVIDRIVRLPDGRLALVENKTTTRDFAPGSEYWQRLYLDPQLSIYLIAARHLGYDIGTILYDVTKRPMQKPLKATPLEARKFTKDGRLYAAQRDRDETPQEFAARVAAAIAEEPDKFFARIEIARLDQDIDDTRRALWQQAVSYRSCQKSNGWYRNPDACYSGTGFFCEYLPICGDQGLEKFTPSDYYRTDDLHPELTAHTAV